MQIEKHPIVESCEPVVKQVFSLSPNDPSTHISSTNSELLFLENLSESSIK